MIITIDGAAGTGKSTVAKNVAKKLGISVFDTGALYRCFAYYSKGKSDLEELARSFRVTIEEQSRYFIDGEDVTEAIRLPEMSTLASSVSAYPFVRESMNRIQRTYAKEHDVVFEGRDIGSVVFPEADYKFFLTASAEIRAKRRFLEMQAKGIEGSYEEVLVSMKKRDHADSTRKVAPLIQPDGATVIDTSNLTIDEVVEVIIAEVKR